LISTIAILRTGGRRTADETQRHPDTSGVLRQIWDGLRLVFGDRTLRVMAILGGIYNFFFTAYQIVNLQYLARELNLSGGAIGLVMAALGPGLLVGAALAAWLPRRFGYGPAILFTAIGANGVVQFVWVVHGSGPLTVVALVGINVLFGVCGLSHAILMRTIRQVMTPDAMQGRVAATNRFVAQGATPVGALLGGLLGGVFDLRTAVLITTVGMASVVMILAISSLPRIGKELPRLVT
jgi:Na+/melibiose symporter-like transporter